MQQRRPKIIFQLHICSLFLIELRLKHVEQQPSNLLLRRPTSLLTAAAKCKMSAVNVCAEARGNSGSGNV